MSTSVKPRYVHDCETSVYLGKFQRYDLYFDPQGGLPTVIARFGDEGHEYQSGMPFVGVVECLTEAARLAVAAGLVDANRRTGGGEGLTIAEQFSKIDKGGEYLSRG